jgi:hypothetical protein
MLRQHSATQKKKRRLFSFYLEAIDLILSQTSINIKDAKKIGKFVESPKMMILSLKSLNTVLNCKS